MNIAFRKMHGLGNDFMVIDARADEVTLSKDQIAGLADRHTGIGFDQLLMLEKPVNSNAHAAYRVFNADGSEVEQCGNGVRCLARYLGSHEGFTGVTVVLDGAAGQVSAELVDAAQVRVDMGEPDFSPAALPFVADAKADRYWLELDGHGDKVAIGAVSIGNPHAVLVFSEALAEAPVAAMGAAISVHPRFPRQTNVEFMQILDAHHVHVRVFERGVGETRACGTGACAAMAMGRYWGLLEQTVQVMLPGGALEITWPGPGSALLMTGPAVDIFGGQIEL